jgi:hypothetical protein
VQKAAVGAYNLGIHKRANGGSVETSSAIQNLTSGTTYLIVARYRTESGTDAMDIWVNPASSAFGTTTPPTASFTSVAGSDTTADWSALAFLPPANAIGTFDELRVGSNWAAVTHLPWNTGDLLDAAETGVTLTGLAANTTTSYRLRAENGTNVSAWSNTLNATTASTANATDWLVQHFSTAFPEGLAAWTADPDGDGQANLLEYATGTAPQTAGATPLASSLSGGFLTLTTPKNPQATDILWSAESSANLIDWSAADTTTLVNTATTFTARDNFPTSTHSRRFLRLRATFAP